MANRKGKLSKDQLKEDTLNREDSFEEDELEGGSPHLLETGETIVVEMIPQCVNCIHNQGAVACESYGEKPSEYMSNSSECPKLKQL